ncbi:MAG: hypothetical protein HQ546_01080 [Planctomycetes bacterium]|nr:hypothetical protein [Planctomycetota bacterium]
MCKRQIRNLALMLFWSMVMLTSGDLCGAPGPAAEETSGDLLIDGCRYATDGQAQGSWVAITGGDPVRAEVLQGRQAVKMPCNFVGKTTLQGQRWEKTVVLDLTKHPGVRFEIYCPPNSLIPAVSFSLGSAGKWGVKTLKKEGLSTGWNIIRIRKAEMDVEGDSPNWAAIRTIRVSVERLGEVNTAFYLAEVRSLQADTMAPLDRQADADRVVLKDGVVLTGSILNDGYSIITMFGKTRLPAMCVLGLKAAGRSDTGVQLVLTDGQILNGTLTETDISLIRPGGEAVNIPFNSIGQFAYRLSPLRPEQALPADPAIIAGDSRVTYTADDLHMTLQTAHGQIDLAPADLAQIELTDGKHRVLFRNGSTLTGTLGPDVFRAQINVGKPICEPGNPITIETRRISRFSWPVNVEIPSGVTVVNLRGDDLVIGQITDSAITIKTDLGAVPVDLADVLSIAMNPIDIGRAVVKLWGVSSVEGRLLEKTINFAIEPGGVKVAVQSAEIVSIEKVKRIDY